MDTSPCQVFLRNPIRLRPKLMLMQSSVAQDQPLSIQLAWVRLARAGMSQHPVDLSSTMAESQILLLSAGVLSGHRFYSGELRAQNIFIVIAQRTALTSTGFHSQPVLILEWSLRNLETSGLVPRRRVPR